MRFPFDVLLIAYEPLDRLPAIRPLGLNDHPLLVVLTPLQLGQGIGRFVPGDFSVPAPGLVQRVLARTVPLTLLLLVEHVPVCGRLLPVPMEAHKY